LLNNVAVTVFTVGDLVPVTSRETINQDRLAAISPFRISRYSERSADTDVGAAFSA
jgi:hypothetical protein